MIYLQLFYEFFTTGLFAIGGGLATLPFLYTMATKTGWFTHAQLVDMVAISESTPGPIGVNMATYVGFTTAGVGGALVATLGLITPSVIIILVIARFLRLYRDNRFVNAAFTGLRPASVGLIAAAGFSVMQTALLNLPLFQQTQRWADLFRWECIVLAVLLFVIIKQWKLHPVIVIAASAVVGIVLRLGGV